MNLKQQSRLIFNFQQKSFIFCYFLNQLDKTKKKVKNEPLNFGWGGSRPPRPPIKTSPSLHLLALNCCANFTENAPQNHSRSFCHSIKPQNLTHKPYPRFSPGGEYPYQTACKISIKQTKASRLYDSEKCQFGLKIKHFTTFFRILPKNRHFC